MHYLQLAIVCMRALFYLYWIEEILQDYLVQLDSSCRPLFMEACTLDE